MAKSHIKVLLIEDNPGDVRLIWEILSEVRNSPFYLNVADSLKTGLEAMSKDKPDIVLLDLSLGDSNGIYTLNRVRDKVPDVPIVILTGMDDEVTAIKSLKEGAQDYLVKGRTDPDLLKRAMIYAIERNSLIFQLADNEKKLRQTDRLKSDFLSMVFHELVIPASSIRTTIAACKKEPGGGDSRIKHMEIIENNTSKLFVLMDDLINAKEIETGKFLVEKQKMDLAGILSVNINDVSAIAGEKEVVIVNESSGKTTGAYVDFHRISQAMTNLLLNAIKFSPEGSRITAGITESAGEVRLYVRDQGAGIKKEDKEKIFDVFFSGNEAAGDKHKRIGLGLFVVRSIVAAHGGKVRVESAGENKGSEFSIILPK